MTVYDVYTDLPPDQLSEVAKTTFRLWLQFALGQDTDVIGKGLKRPSGRYAASLSWQKTAPNRVSISANEAVAPEALWMETGTVEHDMKVMLNSYSKISASGERYRVIPLRPDGADGPLAFNMASLVKSAGGEKLPTSVGRIWAKPRVSHDPNSTYVTMRASSPGWIIPAMPAYAPALKLKDMLTAQYGSG